jgi:hypothetical protein
MARMVPSTAAAAAAARGGCGSFLGHSNAALQQGAGNFDQANPRDWPGAF